MITRIRGTLEAMDGNLATIAVGDGSLAHEVLVPAFDAARLSGQVGRTVVLYTLEYLESQNQGASFTPRLIGFRSVQDRRFFELFTTVKGIGNRKALRAMARPPGVIAAGIAAKDPRSLSELPEIGKRLAETIIAELSGKVEGYLSADELDALDRAAEVKAGPAAGVLQDTIAALEALGETRADSERMATQALTRAKRDGLASATVEQLLPLALGARG